MNINPSCHHPYDLPDVPTDCTHRKMISIYTLSDMAHPTDATEKIRSETR